MDSLISPRIYGCQCEQQASPKIQICILTNPPAPGPAGYFSLSTIHSIHILHFPLLSPIYRCSSIRMYLTVRRRTAWAHYDKHTRMLLTQCLDSLWQPNSFNPGRDSNPSPADKSVNKAIKAEQEPLLSPTKNSINLIPTNLTGLKKLPWCYLCLICIVMERSQLLLIILYNLIPIIELNSPSWKP